MKSLWSGYLAFGKLTIPVKLYSATERRGIKLSMIDTRDNAPAGQQWINKRTGEEIESEDVGRGYEYEDGKYIPLSKEDFRRAQTQKAQTIEIQHFTNEADIDSLYFDTPYYMEPGEEASKAYVLIREALSQTDKVAVVSYVFRRKEHLGIIKPYQSALVLNQLRFQSEIRDTNDLFLPIAADYSNKEMDTMRSLVDRLTHSFQSERYTDTYTESLKQVIEAKMDGKEISEASSTPEVSGTDDTDLTALLEESIPEEEE